MNTSSPYQTLENLFRETALIGEAMSVLHWDMAVMMPNGGFEARGEQLAALKVIEHSKAVDPKIGDLLDQAEETALSDLNEWQKANLTEMRRGYVHATALDADLVEAHSKACSNCESIWREAKKESDFNTVLPALQEVLDLSIQVGEAKAEKLGLSLYNALLDQYEPDGRAEEIAPIFEDYAVFLPEFLPQVIEKQSQHGQKTLAKGPFSVDIQRQITKKFAETVGFDFDAGRLDESAHPFSTGHRGDQRITVRYEKDTFGPGLMAVLHECGHAMYEKGLPKEWSLQPVGESRGMAIHESQSLIVEMQACRSREFYQWAAPVLQEAFGQTEGFGIDELHRDAIWVEPGFIRVDADEVTYPAHVILRFQLEQALLNGDMKLTDLPSAWNEGMEKLLGITPPNHALGCMQDIHWFDGAWGYFPTYTLGAMSAAQLFLAANEEKPEIKTEISKGNFAPLMSWLGENIHQKASRYSSQELMKQATGRALDPTAFKNHLTTRYLG
ncbi:carboxypeptidase M32 [Curvivirga aplysinae]|uniref:carboxypeptidase M32 n=1 Tax=Curvivirga aplysinae TaxID=2529852 RepID=UPI0012BCA1E6|nr:carboxypeptidase M32 [Curvivirga aplysinae]MTI09238.1 carboxypeptidase M32 [Curvivirga aplysinae]